MVIIIVVFIDKILDLTSERIIQPLKVMYGNIDYVYGFNPNIGKFE